MQRLMSQGRRMAVLFVAGMTTLAVTAAPGPVLAQPAPQGTIITQGHGEVKVRPDSMSVGVTVESRNAQLAAARAENNRKTQAIINALRGLNIPNLKLETQSVQVYPIQGEAQRNQLPKVVGYQVTNSLNVTVTGATADMLGEYGSRIVDTALNAGANNVGGLNFYLTDMATPRAQALTLAVQDARRNADAMARAADVTLSGIYSLEGYPQFGGYPRPVPMYSMKSGVAAAEMAQTPIETGETTITSDVTARFKF
jgi:uncharacterized protein YggE